MAAVATPEMDHGTAFIVTKLKKVMKGRGANGFLGLQRAFRIIAEGTIFMILRCVN